MLEQNQDPSNKIKNENNEEENVSEEPSTGLKTYPDTEIEDCTEDPNIPKGFGMIGF